MNILNSSRARLGATALCGIFGVSALVALAASPDAGTLSESNKQLAFTAGPYPVANTSGLGGDYVCDDTNPCDNFALTVDLSAAYISANPDDVVRIVLTPDGPGDDVELQLRAADGSLLGSSRNGPGVAELVVLDPVAGQTQYTVETMGGTPATGASVSLTLTSVTSPAPPAPTGLPPRFHNYAPDYPKDGFGMFGGEATLDVNWNTGSIFYLGFLETLRLKLDDSTSPAIQTWEKMATVASSKATSDPIMVGDRNTGRIFAMQLLLGPGTSAMDYTDDDGETFTPGMAGSLLRSGADHQGMDVGPYPAGTLIPHPTYPNAIYYCSQDVAQAYCSRSDDGGVTFGPSTQIYTQGNCNGLHGHPKVASDGVVYVPNSKCTPLGGGGGVGILSSRNAVAVSEDAGLTWEIRFVGETLSGGGADPSIASATDGTVYLSYVAEDNTLHMTKSSDHGLTWTNDVEVGALAGITAAEFPAVVAGDPDRAAVAFFGSTFTGGGDPESGEGYGGTWDLYVATTYDGGQSYHVVNVTPGDPIQRGPICGGNYCRNLLDFFDAVIDPQGRILVAYEDGCVGGCVLGGISQYSDQAVIARQSGGRRLFAAQDPVEPAKPGVPRIGGYRTGNFAVVQWPAPDNGGSAVTEYKVYRRASSGALTLLATAGNTLQYVDLTPPAGPLHYRVTATNLQGESAMGNELLLNVGDNAPTPELACTLPGVRMALDVTGESEAAPLTRDIAEIYVAEPEDMPGKIVISHKIAEAAPQQAGGKFFTYFDTNTQPDRTWRAALGPEGMPLDFWDGHVIPTDDTLDSQREYTPAGTLETGTGFTSDGFVRMVFDKAKLSVATGDHLLAVNGRSFPSVRGSNVLTEEAGYFDYQLVGNDYCARGGIVLPPGGGAGAGPVITPAVAPQDSGRFGAGALGLGLLGLLLMAGLRRRR